MRKIALLIPLCLLVCVSTMISGCTTAESDSQGTILGLALQGISPYRGDIGFTFTYVNEAEDSSVELIVEYKVGSGDWTRARVLQNSGDSSTADLVGSTPEYFSLYWDSDGDNIGLTTQEICYLRVTPGTHEDAVSDEVEPFIVDNM